MSDLNIAKARILLIGINYAPEVTGIAPYTSAVGRHLASLDADVTVLTGVPHYPEWKVASGYQAVVTRTEYDQGVRVIRVRHYVPRRQNAIRRGLLEASWLCAAACRALTQSPDVVLAVSPALAAMPLAQLVARNSSAPWGVVVQDLMGNAAASSGLGGGRGVSGVVTRAERWFLASADRVGVIGSGFRSAVRSMGVHESRIRLLPNWAHVDRANATRDEARRRLGWNSTEYLIVHTGNMGAKQGLENVVDVARRADQAGLPLSFVLVGDGSQRRYLRRAAQGLERIRFVPPVAESDYPLVLAAADVLLVNERPGMLEMSLPSKLTSYLQAGRPVVAAVPSGGWTASLLAETNAAVVVDAGNPDALLAAVNRLRQSPVDQAAMGRAALAYAEANYSPAAGLGRYRDFVMELLTLSERMSQATVH